ncbi:MAG: dipeptidase [Armatimonadota bacterium]
MDQNTAAAALERARALHARAIVMDVTCPLANRPEYLERWIAGGATAIAPSLASTQDSRAAMRSIAAWLRRIEMSDGRFCLVLRADDIVAAKRDRRLGLIFHFQGADPVEDDLDLVRVYHRLGVRIIQLTYNRKNRVGDGCEERTDAGLSRFGVALIREMNRLGMVVDCSHTGVRTTLDAMEVSTAPVIFSHANARTVQASARNLTDEQIRAVANVGGVIGMVGYPAFVASEPRPSIDAFVRHIDYVAGLVGAPHIGLGIDYFQGQAGVATDEQAQTIYRDLVDSGVWEPANYPPPPWHYPAGMELPDGLPRLTEALVRRGYADADIEGILGGNFLRVFRQVWG